MIKFSGELSRECKKSIVKDLRNGMLIAALIAMCIVDIPIVIVACFTGHLIILLFLAIPLLFLASPFVDAQKNAEKSIPQEIIIEDDKIEKNIEGSNEYAIKSINDVIAVFDYGEWYKFSFSFPKSCFFVCQKNLIKEGTIEEFEEFFKDKLVKK